MIVRIVPVLSQNVQTIGTIIWKRYPDDSKRPRRLRRPRSLGESWVLSGRWGRSCKFWRDHMKRAQTTETTRTIIPVIENNFGPDGAEAKKVIHKCSQRVWGLFEIGESPWNQVFEEMLCLRGTLLVSQCRKIKRKSRYQVTRFTLRIKIIHLCGLFAKHARKNSIVWPRDIADDPASLAFEAIETIKWKPPIAPVVRIVSKYFETTGAIGTIRTIIWKPGLTSFTPEALTGCQNLDALQKSTYVTHLAN